MEAYKKLKARKSKHTHIKPPKKEKKKPATVAKPAQASAAPHERRRPETVIDEEGTLGNHFKSIDISSKPEFHL